MNKLAGIFAVCLAAILLPTTLAFQYVGNGVLTCDSDFDPASSYWTCNGGVVVLCPEGDGSTVAVGAYILNECSGHGAIDPQADAEDVRLVWNGGTGPCSLGSNESIHIFEPDGWHANSSTDAETGYTEITMNPCGSGFAENGHIMVALMTGSGPQVFPNPPLSAACLPIKIRSPDLDHDGDVDLSDYSTFGYWYTHTYDAGNPACRACDFNADGDVALEDYATFGQHYGHSCEDCPRTTQSCNPS